MAKESAPSTSHLSQRRAHSRRSTLSLVCVGVGVALQIVCAWLTVPAVIPFTMQTFAVVFALCFLGPARGTAVVAIYLLLGMVGVPVFSGFGGGVGTLLGPTGGYLVGFLASALVYWLGAVIVPRAARSVVGQCVLCVVGLAACYLLGTVWFVYVYQATDSWAAALMVCVVPYLLPDAVKLTLAVSLAKVVGRWLPHVARPRRESAPLPQEGETTPQ